LALGIFIDGEISASVLILDFSYVTAFSGTAED